MIYAHPIIMIVSIWILNFDISIEFLDRIRKIKGKGRNNAGIMYGITGLNKISIAMVWACVIFMVGVQTQ